MSKARQFEFFDDIPYDWQGLPGVYPNKTSAGWRVPHNLLAAMGKPLPRTFSDDFGQRQLDKVLQSPLLWSETHKFVKPHQLRILRKAFARRGILVKAPAGAGKTLTGLIYAANYGGPRLIITLAGLRKQWEEEVVRWTEFVPMLLLGQSPPDWNDAAACRNFFGDTNQTIYITAWETLTHWREIIVNRLMPSVVIGDEIQVVKNPKRAAPLVAADGSVTWVDMQNQAAAASEIFKAAEYTAGLSATPMPSKAIDLWSIVDLIEPWQYGGKRSYGIRYCGASEESHPGGTHMSYGSLTNIDELKARLRFTMASVGKAEVDKDMPAFRRLITRVPVDQQDKVDREKFKADLQRFGRAAIAGDEEAKENFAATLSREASMRKRTVGCEKLLNATLSGSKCVLFTGLRDEVIEWDKAIRAHIKAAGYKVPPFPIWASSGEDGTAVRDTIRKEYMEYQRAPGPNGPIGCINICSADAWGRGYNLQDTDYCLDVMLPWTPEKIQQREGRFKRLGSKVSAVLYEYLLAEHSYDERIAELVLDKLPAQIEILDEHEFEALTEDLAPQVTDMVAAAKALFGGK